MDAVLSSQVELMEEYKKGEHTSWDPNQEFQTWKRREVVLAVGEDETDEEDEDEEELPLVVGSSKQVELGGSSKQIGPNVSPDDAASDMGEQGPIEPTASHEDITRD